MDVKIVLRIPGDTLAKAIQYAFADPTILTEQAQWYEFKDDETDSIEHNVRDFLRELKEHAENAEIEELRKSLTYELQLRAIAEARSFEDKAVHKADEETKGRLVDAIERLYDVLIKHKTSSNLPPPPISALRRMFLLAESVVGENSALYQNSGQQKADRDIIIEYLHRTDVALFGRGSHVED